MQMTYECKGPIDLELSPVDSDGHVFGIEGDSGIVLLCSDDEQIGVGSGVQVRRCAECNPECRVASLRGEVSKQSEEDLNFSW
jgi:hypothetical protein